MAEENSVAQRQTEVTAYLKSKQLLLFVFARYASTRWQKRILQLKDKQQLLLTWKVSSYCCLSLHVMCPGGCLSTSVKKNRFRSIPIARQVAVLFIIWTPINQPGPLRWYRTNSVLPESQWSVQRWVSSSTLSQRCANIVHAGSLLNHNCADV